MQHRAGADRIVHDHRVRRHRLGQLAHHADGRHGTVRLGFTRGLLRGGAFLRRLGRDVSGAVASLLTLLGAEGCVDRFGQRLQAGARIAQDAHVGRLGAVDLVGVAVDVNELGTGRDHVRRQVEEVVKDLASHREHHVGGA